VKRIVPLLMALVLTGCGESHVHTGAEVKAAFAKHGIRVDRFHPTPVERHYRVTIHRPSPTLLTFLALAADRILTLGSRTAKNELLFGDTVSVIVLRDNVQAWGATRTTPARRFDNLLVLGRGPRVEQALAELRR
jgi:hypothetical protein